MIFDKNGSKTNKKKNEVTDSKKRANKMNDWVKKRKRKDMNNRLLKNIQIQVNKREQRGIPEL